MFRSLLSLSVFAFLCLPSISLAATVTKVKGKSALIDLKGDAASPGDTFFAVNDSGKRVAIIKVAKVKGDKAIGRITKGNAAAGMNLEMAPAGRTAGKKSAAPASGDSRSYYGVLLGYGRDSMDVNVNDSISGAFREKASLSGSGFSAKGLFDYEVFPQVWFRFTSGLEMFKVSGKAGCGELNSKTCDANINYISMDFVGRYVFMTGAFRPWAGAGAGLLFPMSKSATALKAESIATTNVLMILGGFDYFLNPNLFIPFSIEYGMLPKSDEVSATWIAFRAGIGIPF